jgi:hypothetical protein
MWSWFCRHEKCKSYGFMEDFTLILKERLRYQAMCGRVRVPAGSQQEGDAWSCEDGAKDAMEIPGTCTIWWGKRLVASGVSPRERPRVLQVSTPFGDHMIHDRHGAMGLNLWTAAIWFCLPSFLPSFLPNIPYYPPIPSFRNGSIFSGSLYLGST